MQELPKKLRNKIYERDNWCQKCGGHITEIHHIYYRNSYPNLIFSENNLLSLCSKCHKWFHFNKNESMIWFENRYPERFSKLQKIKNLNSKDI